MEEVVNKAVNLAIGAVLAAKEGLENTAANLQEEINSLIAKGESVNTEQTQKIREAADKAIAYLNELQAKADEATEQVKSQLEPVIERAKSFIEKVQSGSTQEQAAAETSTEASA